MGPLLPGAAQAQAFGNDEQSCVHCGGWAVLVIYLAASQGCGWKRQRTGGAHASRQVVHGQSPRSMSKAPQVHRNGVVSRCAKQGASVKITK